MLQNMMITTLTSLGDKKEVGYNSWENHPFTVVWPDQNLQTGNVEDVTKRMKRKPKRVRTSFTTDQIRMLERYFSRHKYITTERRKEMAKALDLSDRCIKLWFQNKRMKDKKESSESSCDSSSEAFNGSILLSTSPPTQINNDCKTEYPTQYSSNNSSIEYSYQLPSYYGMSDVSQEMYLANSHNGSAFYNDDNVYPTHYYPNSTNCANIDSITSNNYSGNEMNQYWVSNYNANFAPI